MGRLVLGSLLLLLSLAFCVFLVERRPGKRNLRAVLWYRLGAWAMANGDAAKLRQARHGLYQVTAMERAGNEEGELEAWGS